MSTGRTNPSALSEAVNATFLVAALAAIGTLLTPMLRDDRLILAPLAVFVVAFLLRAGANRRGD